MIAQNILDAKMIYLSARAVLDRLFFVVPGCLLVVDLIFLGSGLWSATLGFSVRKFCFVSVCVYSLINWLSLNHLKFSEIASVFFLSVFCLLWAFFVPLFFFADLEASLSDAQLFFGLLFAPVIYSTLGAARWLSCRKWIFGLTCVLAVIHLLVVFYNFINPDGLSVFVAKVKSILEPLNEDGDSSILVGYVAENFRVFWGSSIFLLVALYFSVRNFFFGRVLKSIFVLLLVILAIFSTLTRGMLLSIPLFVVSAIFFRFFLKFFRLTGALVLVYGLILASITVPVMILSDPALLSFMGIGRDVSDDIRGDQVAMLSQSMLGAPIMGHGFGYFLDQVRSETAPWSYEMSILALYMKIGFAGIFMLLLTLLMFFYTGGLANLNKEEAGRFSWIAAFGVIVTFCSNTNPYLFSMLGVGLVMFMYFEFRLELALIESDRVCLV